MLDKEAAARSASYMYGPDIPRHYHVKKVKADTEIWLNSYLAGLNEEDRAIAKAKLSTLVCPTPRRFRDLPLFAARRRIAAYEAGLGNYGSMQSPSGVLGLGGLWL